MTRNQSLEDRVAEHYAELSGQLRKAADYVLSNPLDIASRSLRAISTESDVSPATFSRLSRALGYATFEEMKDISRQSVGQRVISLSDRADALRTGSTSGPSMLERQSKACIANIDAFVAQSDQTRLEATAELMRSADRVLLLGALASTGVAEYMGYLAQYFAPNWTLAGRMGGSMGSEIARLTPDSVVFIVTKSPYAYRAVSTAKLAHASGASVVLVTDSHKCPALRYAAQGFVLPSDSPQFFSSYVVTILLIETLIAMIVATSEADETAAIRKVEARNQDLGEYWSETL